MKDMTFDFEDLIADMLGVTDEQRQDAEYLDDTFFAKYAMDLCDAYPLVVDLLSHTPKVQTGLSGKVFHAFVSKSGPVMLMKIEAGPPQQAGEQP